MNHLVNEASLALFTSKNIFSVFAVSGDVPLPPADRRRGRGPTLGAHARVPVVRIEGETVPPDSPLQGTIALRNVTSPFLCL